MTSAISFPAWLIGLMSGTSADGVDAALLRTDGRAVTQAGASIFVPYDDGLRGDILALMRGTGDEADVARRLTDVHILAVRILLAKADLAAAEVQLIGFHGQTVRHAPHEGITRQIGDGQRMAHELGIPVVADFRTNDVKHGGQGAPLVPLYHAALAASLPKPVMVVNIGGVSNATWIGSEIIERGLVPHASRTPAASGSPAGLGTPQQPLVIGFDIGPGNALMDDWVSKHTGARYDKDGALAASGIAESALVNEFLRDPYFLKDAPKSLDRNHFNGWLTKLSAVIPGSSRGEGLLLEDGAATLASMTATAIALSFGCVPAPPKQVLICGGGRRNAHLMGLLKSCVNAPVLVVEEVGWDGDMLEAQAFAYLAARSVQGLPLSLPTTTGVKEPVTGGVFYAVGGE